MNLTIYFFSKDEESRCDGEKKTKQNKTKNNKKQQQQRQKKNKTKQKSNLGLLRRGIARTVTRC